MSDTLAGTPSSTAGSDLTSGHLITDAPVIAHVFGTLSVNEPDYGQALSGFIEVLPHSGTINGSTAGYQQKLTSHTQTLVIDQTFSLSSGGDYLIEVGNGTSVQLFDSGSGSASFDITVSIPEPASFSLLGVGALGLLARRRRRA